jgi:hypothetical protein
MERNGDHTRTANKDTISKAMKFLPFDFLKGQMLWGQYNFAMVTK